MSETNLQSFFRGVMSPITKGNMIVFFPQTPGFTSVYFCSVKKCEPRAKADKVCLNHVKIFLRLNVFREFLEEKSRKMFLDGVARNTAIRQESSSSVWKKINNQLLLS